LRSVNSTVEWLGPDEQDPSSVVVKVALVPGLANTSLKIGRDQLEVFLAILGVASEGDLVGHSVRVTVDDEKGTEQIAFPRPPAPAVEPAVRQEVEPAVPVAAESAANPAAVDPAAVDPAADQSLLVIADSKPADEVTVYDNVAERVAIPVGEPDDCGEAVAVPTPADAAGEERARAQIAAAATAPVEQRYFLYRETYGKAARGTSIELTPEEFALLGGPDAYLHVEDCGVIDSQTLPADAAEDIERLLARTTTRPDADLTRAELERLTSEGRVVSCAVY
jgi:hypothetical protein